MSAFKERESGVSKQHGTFLFRVMLGFEDEGTALLRNVGTYLAVDMVYNSQKT
jgi:hypothetical protein